MSTLDLITSPGAERGPIHTTADDALALFDQLAPCQEHILRGLWRGREICTGHPLDGSLANVSWYGKRFDSPTKVHPLVVVDSTGNPYPLNPAVVPMPLITHPVDAPKFVKSLAPKLMRVLRPVARAHSHGAHLDIINHRGVTTVAMVYDDRPVIDVFRSIDENTVVGCMEYPGMPRPHFFVLQRDNGETDVR